MKGGKMLFNFENLDSVTRKFMLEEVDLDIEKSNSLFK